MSHTHQLILHVPICHRLSRSASILCDFHFNSPRSPLLLCCIALYVGDSHSTFVHSLAERVLSVDPFLKPKYIYSGILADHVSVVIMLQVRPHLPLEIMDAMGYQSLAPHVSHKHAYMYMHTQQGCGSSACYGVKLNGDVVEQSLSKGVNCSETFQP